MGSLHLKNIIDLSIFNTVDVGLVNRVPKSLP